MLFDLPAVADAGADPLRRRRAVASRARRSAAISRDPLPQGADVVSLVRVVHDHDDGAALGAAARCHRALPRDGTLLIAEPMADTPGAEPVGDAYFGFYLLAMGSGRPRRRTNSARWPGKPASSGPTGCRPGVPC